MHVVLAGGGTAGHTSPLVATAQALLDRPGVTVSAIGTPRGLEQEVVPAAGLELDMIDPVPMPRALTPQLFGVPGHLLKAVRQAGSVLRRRGAAALVGFGGYVSTPAYLAARQAGIPFFIHEQNALPGLANKLGRRLGGKVAVSFPDTPLPGSRYLGLPLRRQITRLAALAPEERLAERAAARRALGLTHERPTILVSGGSQGARSINTVTELAAPGWTASGIDVVHVWGPRNFQDQQRSSDPVTGAEYLPLRYVDAMEQAYLASDLMVGRSGAGTVIETAVAGLPAIFVPLPIGNGEQARNAAALVAAGGAVLIEDDQLTASWLEGEARALVTDPARLAAMRAAGHDTVPADAADKLAAWVLAEVH